MREKIEHRTRLAPSPTGALHLGNIRTFLINWALAKQNNWRIVLRIEDIDGPRNKPDAVTEALRVFDWLGITYDEGPIYQSKDIAHHHAAMDHLCKEGSAYLSTVTRKEAADAASAPHESTTITPVYGLAHRPTITPAPFTNPNENHRFATPPGSVTFTDTFAGQQAIDAQATLGDPVIWRRVGMPAYHLAAVADDARQGITQIVRGDDLLPSAALHIRMYEALRTNTGATRSSPASSYAAPTYTHLPLVAGEDGRRLAKRHGDTRVLTYKDIGCPPERLIGLIAKWCTITQAPSPITANEFAHQLNLATIPKHPIVFTAKDDQWLTDTSNTSS